MTGRSPTAIHTERRRKATHEALQQYVRDVRRRQREQRRAARQQQEQAR
jgi:hypothetical protein